MGIGGAYGRSKSGIYGSRNNAIYAVLVGGQSYKIGSRQLTRADLSLLRTMQNDLQAQLAQDQQSGLLDDCYVAVFQGR